MSNIREMAKISHDGWDYGQRGLVASLEIDGQGFGNETAWQRFLPTGPLAMLPVGSSLIARRYHAYFVIAAISIA